MDSDQASSLAPHSPFYAICLSSEGADHEFFVTARKSRYSIFGWFLSEGELYNLDYTAPPAGDGTKSDPSKKGENKKKKTGQHSSSESAQTSDQGERTTAKAKVAAKPKKGGGGGFRVEPL